MQFLKQVSALLALGALFIAAQSSVTPAKADRLPPATPGNLLDDNDDGWTWDGMDSISDTQCQGGTAHAGGPGSSGIYLFKGTDVAVYTISGPHLAVNGKANPMGKLKVMLDGKEQQTVDLSAPTTAYNFKAYSVSGLSGGNHVLELRPVDGWAAIDYIQVSDVVPLVADYSHGFRSTDGLTLNGGAIVYDGNLFVALAANPKGHRSNASVFTDDAYPTKRFIADFHVLMTEASADGMTFCIQGGEADALSTFNGGSGLGFATLPKSVGVKLDLYNNNGEGINSTGLYRNGMEPTTPATDLTNTGINLHNQHILDITLDYQDNVLTVTEFDTVTKAKATQTYPINIPQSVGPKARFGFTGATFDSTANIGILSWTLMAAG